MQPLSLEQYLLLGVISLIAVGLLTPVMRLVAKRYGVIDSPSESHKTHKNPVPYLGGVAIAIGVVGVTYVASLVSDFSRETFFLASTHGNSGTSR
jgi:UDP-GlcNAc:undecaprenyl-phosphate/decaprenyl-phosphate GlcNAc-1-phosphate transferase